MRLAVKILKKYMLILIVIFMEQSIIHGLFDCKKYKGLLTVFNEENRELSPVFGALACTSGFLENIYNWAPEGWPTYILAQQMFNILEVNGRQEGPLRLSILPSNIVGLFDGKLIGKIVVWLINGQSDRDFKELIKIIVEKHWSSKLEVEISKEREYKYLQVVKAYLKKIAKSYNFDSRVTVMMLTAVLYLKQCIEKKEMMDYLEILQNGLGNVIFIEPLTQELKTRIEGEVYVSEELTRSSTLESEMVSSIRGDSVFPPEVLMARYGFAGQKEVSNCVETALNDLFNLLLYNFDSKRFDLGLLPVEVQASLNPRFKSFYESYSVEKINSNEAGQSFMDMVSAIDGVVYVADKNYEIDATVDNLLIVINKLLGTNASSWAELCTMLSTKERTIKEIFSYLSNVVKIEIDNPVNKINFALHILHKIHASLECENRKFSEPLYNLGNDIDNENKHYFFTFGIKNKNIEVMPINKISSYEIRLDILNTLLKRNYCNKDSFLKRKLTDVYTVFNVFEMEQSLYDSDMFDRISTYIKSLYDLEKNDCEDLAFFFRKTILYESFKNRMLFLNKIIQTLPEGLFAVKERDGGTIFGIMLLSKCYELAELCIRIGGEGTVFSLNGEAMQVKILKNLIRKYFSENIDSVERMRIQFLLSCKALSFEVLKGKNLYPLDVYEEFFKILNDLDFSVVEYEEKMLSFNFLIQLVVENKIDCNAMRVFEGVEVTILDSAMLMLRQKTMKMEAMNQTQEDYIKLEREKHFLNNVIKKLREVGAKTAMELKDEVTQNVLPIDSIDQTLQQAEII